MDKSQGLIYASNEGLSEAINECSTSSFIALSYRPLYLWAHRLQNKESPVVWWSWLHNASLSKQKFCHFLAWRTRSKLFNGIKLFCSVGYLLCNSLKCIFFIIFELFLVLWNKVALFEIKTTVVNFNKNFDTLFLKSMTSPYFMVV